MADETKVCEDTSPCIVDTYVRLKDLMLPEEIEHAVRVVLPEHYSVDVVKAEGSAPPSFGM